MSNVRRVMTVMGLVLSLLLAGGCGGGNTPEALAEQMVEVTTRIAELLEGIKTQADLDNACGSLERQFARMGEIDRAGQAMYEGLASAEQRAMKEKVGEERMRQGEASTQRMMKALQDASFRLGPKGAMELRNMMESAENPSR